MYDMLDKCLRMSNMIDIIESTLLSIFSGCLLPSEYPKVNNGTFTIPNIFAIYIPGLYLQQ